MSGPPLTGKSYLSKILVNQCPDEVQVVKSRDLRPLIAKAMGRKRPTYEKLEHEYTFALAIEIVHHFLTNKWSVIADATNLKEEYRKWVYEAGERSGSEIVVAFMTVTDKTAMERLSTREKGASSATFDVYKKLVYEMEPTNLCTKPYIIIDSEVDLRPHTIKLKKWLCGRIDDLPGLRNPYRSH